MAGGKLTKTELRAQQYKMAQLQKYLPTLQLKKAMLQSEVDQVEGEIREAEIEFNKQRKEVASFSSLFSDADAVALIDEVAIEKVELTWENIAGIDVPIFEDVFFKKTPFPLLTLPIWFESAAEQLKNLIWFREKLHTLRKRKEALEKELREVSIRVNLFEKVMIPRAADNIKRIKIFLGDQQLAAIAQAKVSKQKILSKKYE